MAISTTLAPRYKWFNIIYAVLCLALGIWGFYDWKVKIPAQRELHDEWIATSATKALLEKMGEERDLQADEKAAYEAAEQRLLEIGGTPPRPGKFNEAIQLWGFVVGCGVLGVPWFCWALFSEGRKRYRLEDDGTLVMPEGTWKKDEIGDIDMSRWMAKSVAWVEHTDGSRVKLDDYKHRNLHLIIGALASERYPDEWTDEAKRVKTDEDDAEELPEDAPADVADEAPEEADEPV